MSMNGFYTWPINMEPKFNPGMISEPAYAEVTANMPIPCADIVPFSYELKGLLLARRCIKPAHDTPWHFGGRRKIGEQPDAAAVRHFLADTGIEVHRPMLWDMGMQEYIFSERQQEPQNVPVHSSCYTFAAELEPGEEDYARDHLDPKEYLPRSLMRYGIDALKRPDVHPVFRSLHLAIFGR